MEESWTNVTPSSETDLCLTRGDIYKEFRLRGYDYEGEFQGITCCNIAGTGEQGLREVP